MNQWSKSAVSSARLARAMTPKAIRNAPSGRAEIGPNQKVFQARSGFMGPPPAGSGSGTTRSGAAASATSGRPAARRGRESGGPGSGGGRRRGRRRPAGRAAGSRAAPRTRASPRSPRSPMLAAYFEWRNRRSPPTWNSRPAWGTRSCSGSRAMSIDLGLEHQRVADRVGGEHPPVLPEPERQDVVGQGPRATPLDRAGGEHPDRHGPHVPDQECRDRQSPSGPHPGQGSLPSPSLSLPCTPSRGVADFRKSRPGRQFDLEGRRPFRFRIPSPAGRGCPEGG